MVAVSVAGAAVPVGAAAAGGPDSAPTARAIAAFDDVCLGGADPSAAAARARGLGFDALPRNEEGLLSQVFATTKTTTALSRTDGPGMTLLQLGRGPALLHGRYPTVTCAIAVSHEPGADFRAAYRAAFGAEPDVKEIVFDLYSFASHGGARTEVPLNTPADVMAAIDAGTYRTVMVGERDVGGAKYDLLMQLIPVDPKETGAKPESSR